MTVSAAAVSMSAASVPSTAKALSVNMKPTAQAYTSCKSVGRSATPPEQALFSGECVYYKGSYKSDTFAYIRALYRRTPRQYNTNIEYRRL